MDTELREYLWQWQDAAAPGEVAPLPTSTPFNFELSSVASLKHAVVYAGSHGYLPTGKFFAPAYQILMEARAKAQGGLERGFLTPDEAEEFIRVYCETRKQTVSNGASASLDPSATMESRKPFTPCLDNRI